jgi:hypothetical protein
MNRYDPLDWIHQWDDYEMMMYALPPDEGEPGIYMQVSRKQLRDGAEEWDILYDRKIGDLPQVEAPRGSELWHEQVLRRYLHAHPQLVADEKLYLAQFLAGGDADNHDSSAE